METIQQSPKKKIRPQGNFFRPRSKMTISKFHTTLKKKKSRLSSKKKKLWRLQFQNMWIYAYFFGISWILDENLQKKTQSFFSQWDVTQKKILTFFF